MLAEEQRQALLVDLHRSIEESASETVEWLRAGADEPFLSYPPNGELSEEEWRALEGLVSTDVVATGLRKLVANAAAGPLWTLFALLDAVGDPESYDGEWMPLELVPSEDGENFHELWLEAYWDWRRRRPDPGWKLDTHEDEE